MAQTFSDSVDLAGDGKDPDEGKQSLVEPEPSFIHSYSTVLAITQELLVPESEPEIVPFDESQLVDVPLRTFAHAKHTWLSPQLLLRFKIRLLVRWNDEEYIELIFDLCRGR